MTRALSKNAFATLVHGPMPRNRVAGLSVPLSAIQGVPRARVGADPTATLSATDIAALDAQVNAQQATLAAKVASMSEAELNAAPDLSIWSANWAAFLADWKPWFTAHGAGTGLGGSLEDFFSDSTLKSEFDAFVGRFNELLREWTAPGPQGGLALPSPAKPAAIPEMNTSWFSGILNTLGTVGTVALVAALAIGGLELYRVLEDKRKF